MKIERKILAIGLGLVCLLSCRSREGYVAITGSAQGGMYSVKVNLEGVPYRPEKIKEGIDSIVTLVDTTLSGYNRSELSRFNRGESTYLSDLFLDMYRVSREFWKETGGALDVAMGPLFDEWGFGFSKGSLSSEEKVDSLLRICGMDLMPENTEELRRDAALGKQRGKLNFNAIAQGYTCDLVAEYLHSLGIKDMLVDIGEIYCEGSNPYGTGWNIAVDSPIDGNQVLGQNTQGVWSGDGSPCGVVTSGNYRKFYIKDGKKFAHTIDPRSGYPVQHNLLSATILAPDATTADALATYCMVIGLEEAIAFIEGRDDLEAFLVYDKDGTMLSWASEGFSITLN